MAEEDPLIKTLPPATDYLTYLTVLEYQLTPARLPTLHKLLQDETLTTNIGWDLVQLLLPMLPRSLECLHDIARLGNPREVILRVSDALMKLEPDDEEEEEEEEIAEVKESKGPAPVAGDAQSGDVAVESDDEAKPLARHIVQFNTLLGMLSVLHGRIRTKSPSRFLATSIQAVLEAYTTMPTNETTLALLEFFREVSPSKRPAPPPRAASESSLLRVAQASAPDPEAEEHSHIPASINDESVLVKRFLQFGLVELLKSYLLSFSGPADPGMSWAIRLQEKLHPEKRIRIPNKASPTDQYTNDQALRERDMIMAKITALSRDFGIDDQQLLDIVAGPPEAQPPPLDFDEPPRTADQIPLERHGSLLLLAARAAMAELFSSGQITPIPVFPDLARIFSNFISQKSTPDEVAFGHPQPLLDSLLTLTVFSMERSLGEVKSEKEFGEFVLTLTACTSRQSYGSIRDIPGAVVHSHPSELVRFKLIRQVLEQERLRTLRDSAIGWLKNEILSAANAESKSSVFLNPHYFSVLFPSLFNASALALNVSTDIVPSWIDFSQTLAPWIHSALSLYYLLISSPTLRTALQLEKTYVFFRRRFLEPLKSVCHAFEADLVANGGDGRIEAAVGEDMCEAGMARSVGLVGHALDQVEDAVGDAFVMEDQELQEPSADDIARVDQIRKETESSI
ncbi:uncharacterized protein BDW47DRAFT_89046 [Aspergillus candidus]|uniref:DUF1760-domain-containing protein n=1 Tax=Aspergillus candidus TaxID=41067 RepID=A0A2I2FIX9_ASPCN|nr:DUF1760-domain-containing protein [Aspergillus candidus]PLB40573.1 DUF1760-domain-containing protein [Aspergillus candidus]